VKNSEIDWQILLKGISGMDVDKGLKRFAGDKDIYLEILRSFVKNTKPVLESLKEVDKTLLTDYTNIVHGLKGSTGSICAQEAADLAGALETAAIDGDHDYIEKNNDRLIEIIRSLLINIEKKLEEIDTDTLKPIKEKPDSEILSRLCEACINYDMKKVDAALEELESYSYETDGEIVVWLRENVEQVNFDEIIDWLS